jgi:hypothetical protein
VLYALLLDDEAMSNPKMCSRCGTEGCPTTWAVPKETTPAGEFQCAASADFCCSLRAIVNRLGKGYIDVRTAEE